MTWTVFLTGLMIDGTASFAAYAIVIYAFTRAPIALVTTLRETGIVCALLIGVGILKERLDLAKLASTFATLTGAALLRLAQCFGVANDRAWLDRCCDNSTPAKLVRVTVVNGCPDPTVCSRVAKTRW